MKYYRINKEKLQAKREELHQASLDYDVYEYRVRVNVLDDILDCLTPSKSTRLDESEECGKVISQDLMGATTCANPKPCKTHGAASECKRCDGFPACEDCKPASECECKVKGVAFCKHGVIKTDHKWAWEYVKPAPAEECTCTPDVGDDGNTYHKSYCKLVSDKPCPSRVEEIREKVNQGKAHNSKREWWLDMKGDISSLLSTIDRLEAENTRYKEALEEIANMSAWGGKTQEEEARHHYEQMKVVKDIARQALTPKD